MAAYGVYYAMAAMAAVSYDQQERAEDKAYDRSQKAADEQRKARMEQQSQNAAQAAGERRRQIREERVRRARIVQSSINTGVTDSSGELGGQANLATQANTAIGFNNAALKGAQDISIFNQNAVDFSSESQSAMAKSNQWGGVGNIFASMVMQGAVSSAKTPSTPQKQG